MGWALERANAIKSIKKPCNKLCLVTAPVFLHTARWLFLTMFEPSCFAAAFPWAAARLADDGSPLALLLKNVPIHLALARALEQVLHAKKDEEKQYRTGQHETLVSRDMGTWHGQLEGDEFASACLDTLKNLQRDDVARALMLAHGNMVDSVWEHISRVRKSRKGIPTRADHSTKTFAAEEESANQTPAHNSSTQDLSPKMFSQFNFSADFNCLVPANDCSQTSVPYSEAKLGILRSVLGNVSCDDDSMLARIEAEHTTDLAATIVFTTPAGVTTTAAQEWIESIRYQSAETALIDAIGDEVDLAIPDSPCSVPVSFSGNTNVRCLLGDLTIAWFPLSCVTVRRARQDPFPDHFFPCWCPALAVGGYGAVAAGGTHEGGL